MYDFFIEPKKLVRARKTLFWLAAVEFYLSISFVLVQLYWIDITTLYSFLIIFQVFHIFSWAISLNVSGRMHCISYIALNLTIYILTLVCDAISLIWRSIIFAECSFDSCDENISFTRAQLVLVISLFVLDILLICVVVIILSHGQKFVSEVNFKVAELMHTKANTVNFKKVPYVVMALRNTIGLVWVIEFWLVLAIALLLLLGFGINPQFDYLLLFLLPHFVTWTVSRVLSGVPNTQPSGASTDIEYIHAVHVIFLLISFIDIAGIIFSFIQVGICLDEETKPCNFIELMLSVLVIILYIFVWFSVLFQSIAAYIIQTKLASFLVITFIHFSELLKSQKTLDVANQNRIEKESRIMLELDPSYGAVFQEWKKNQ